MRVIRDSDDEFEEDEDLEEEDAKIASSNSDINASLKPLRLTPSPLPEPGTGSTDSLKRNIAEAHANFCQSPSIPSLPTQPPQDKVANSSSSSEHRDKRRKTDTHISPAKPSHKSLEIYARSKSVFSSPSLDPGQATYTAQAVEDVAERPWGLEGTLRENYDTHEMMVMFPETSSTVPNATLTQQRLLDEVMNPAFLGLDANGDAPLYEPAKSSVPWSEFLHSQPTQPNPEPPNTCNVAEQTLQDVGLHNGVDPKEIMESLPMPSQDNRSDPAYASKMGHTLPPAPALPPPKPKSSFVLESGDDFALIGIPKENYKPRPTRSRSTKSDLEHPVDYSVIPEKASKRGTRRSRTYAGGENAVEQSTPQKMKQICEMGFTPETTRKALEDNQGNVSQAVNWLINNGPAAEEDELAPPRTLKSRSKSKKSKKDADALGQKVDPSIEGASSPQSRKRRVSFTVPEDADTGKDAGRADDSTTDAKTIERSPQAPSSKSPKVSVVIPSSKGPQKRTKSQEHRLKANTSDTIDLPMTPSQKPKSRQTILDEPEPAIEEQATTMPTPTKETKRGRGRPRKDAPVSISNIPESEEETSGERVLQEMQSNAIPTGEPSVSERQAKTTEPPVMETTRASTPPPSKVTAATSSRTPERSTRPAPGSQNKGQAPYRVGLSKRARIAPLLRMVKK
ncbi:hypothetical protein K504DRAFT_492975 [Pleomassaria siparia CBS 279.74]|uniref:UBA domain-containing protein n=1 Tax=Pleomassaria siparia CBS 279.74 TaxID=1314801 RepID=A0A6G1K119_9PLEO|nr:hypothetical protein K504DRAFT_492975 [Pleomassaria siparia CBS 279.74]